MKNIPTINATRIIEARRRKSGKAINPEKLRRVDKTPESSQNNRTNQNIRDIHSKTLQNSTISFDQINTSNHKLFKNKEEFNNYMLYKKYFNSKNQYQKIITQLSYLENRIKENDENIDKMKNYLITLKQNKKQKQADIVNLLSNKESLEEIYKSKIYHLKNKSLINKINKPNANNNEINEKDNKKDNNKVNLNYKENQNQQNDQFDNNSIDNENNNINNNLCTQNSTRNLFEGNNYEASIEEIRLSDKQKFEEQVINFSEEILQKKNKELRNTLREKVVLAYQIFESEYNSVSSIDPNTIIYNFFTRISLFISNQSLGNYSEQFINSFLRHLIKINYIGEEISQVLKFLNKKYKEIKLETKEKINNLIKTNENLKNKKMGYEIKRDELKKFIEENKDISKSKDKHRKYFDEDNHSNSHGFSFISDSNLKRNKSFTVKSNDKSDRIKWTKIPNNNKSPLNIIRDNFANKITNSNQKEKAERNSADKNNKTNILRRRPVDNENNEKKNHNKIYKIKNIQQITDSLNLENISKKILKINENGKKNTKLSNKLNKKMKIKKVIKLNKYQINTYNNGYKGIDKKDGITINRIDNVGNINVKNKQIINVNNLLINNNINIENNNIINNNDKLKNENINPFYSKKTMVHSKKSNTTFFSENRKISNPKIINIPDNNFKNESTKMTITENNINGNIINGKIRKGFKNSNISEIQYNKTLINSKLNNFQNILKDENKKPNSKIAKMLNNSSNNSQTNINNKSMILNSPIQNLNNGKIIIIPKENLNSEIINNNNKLIYNSKTLVNRIKSPKMGNEENILRSPPNNNNNDMEVSELGQNYINKNIIYNSNTYVSRKDELNNKGIDKPIVDKYSIYSKRYDNRLKVLTKDIKDSFCYFKISDKDNFNFDPLNNCSSTPESFGYIDGYISIDIVNHKFRISPKHSKDKNNNTNLSESNSNEENNEGIKNYIGIELKDIAEIIITQHMKNIIRIYNAYVKHSAGQENVNVNRFIYSRELNDIPMEQNERIKAAFCNYFIFYLIVGKKSIPKIEFIFINYEHFNLWLDCLQYICKYNIQNQNVTTINSRTYNTNTNVSPNRKNK